MDQKTLAVQNEARWKAKWDASPELQKEFRGKFVTYLAYKKAKTAGLVNIAKRKINSKDL